MSINLIILAQLCTYIFWTATYVLILINCIWSYKKRGKYIGMPLDALVLNISWEASSAIYTNGLIGILVWLLIDILIYYYEIKVLTKEKKVVMVLSTIIAYFMLYASFHLSVGYFISAFLIDLYMALSFLVQWNSISRRYQIIIGTLKLVGSACAGIGCYMYHPALKWIATIVFAINFLYLCLVIKNKYSTICLKKS